MPNLVTYSIDKMRAVPPKGKTAENHPERFLTVSGVFYSTSRDDKGKVTRKDKLSFTSKNIDREDALSEGFAIDVVAGTLTLPEGTRGRQAAEGLTADAIAEALAALRTPPATEPGA